jgi:ABC-type amino acid transport substrate-binding protein
MSNAQLFLLTLLIAITHPLSAQTTELVMGYRTNERLPYIDDQTNEGIYQALYSEACRKIGATLKIIRLPKIRIQNAIEQGTVDFYPGYTFTSEREQSAFFFPNGLTERYVIVNRLNQSPIQRYEDLAGKSEVQSLGNPSFLPAHIREKVKTTHVGELGVERALRILEAGRVDFYIYDELTLRYYWPSLATDKLRLNDSLDTPTDMYTGWSKKSAHYKVVKNPAYQREKPLSPENHPDKLDPKSLAGQLQSTLKTMRQSGETDAIIKKYINNPAIKY